jgi:hypothetical protein
MPAAVRRGTARPSSRRICAHGHLGRTSRPPSSFPSCAHARAIQPLLTRCTQAEPPACVWAVYVRRPASLSTRRTGRVGTSLIKGRKTTGPVAGRVWRHAVDCHADRHAGAGRASEERGWRQPTASNALLLLAGIRTQLPRRLLFLAFAFWLLEERLPRSTLVACGLACLRAGPWAAPALGRRVYSVVCGAGCLCNI